MQSHNDFSEKRNRLAYLTALTLIFSYAELLFPRFIPFFKPGLSNIVILSSLDLPASTFFLLASFKALAASLMSGTLFSPFAAISLAQSVLSGFFMLAVFRLNNFFKKKIFSLYGISVLGSTVSAAAQIFLSALYLGKGTLLLLGPMLIFNAASGIFTAFSAQFFKIPSEAPVLRGGSLPLGRTPLRPAPSAGSNAALRAYPGSETNNARFFNILKISAVISLSVSVFFIKSVPVLSAFFALSLLLQFFSGRKILFMPYIFLWSFVIASCIFVPSGKILLQIGNLSVTQGALLAGTAKALRLSAASAFSQCAANLDVPEKSFTGLTLSYYRALLHILKATPGNIVQRLKTALSATELPAE